MGEIGINEKKIEYSRVEDIKPNSEINMNDCKNFWDNIFSENFDGNDAEREKEGLSQKEKGIVKNETGWSDKIIDSIRSMDEYRIYKDANLSEGVVNGKECLIRSDIDLDQSDQYGTTNRERMSDGLAPLDKDGKPIQLHHMGQHKDSPLAELTFEEHRGGGNDKILHDKAKVSEVHGEGSNWDGERQSYWKNRGLDGGRNE